MPVIDFLRRLLGVAPPGEADDGARAVPAEVAADAAAPEPPVQVAAVPEPVACPSCGFLIDPPPARNRRCPSCRTMIVVRHLDGHPAYLSEAAVAVFEAERLRERNELAWDAARVRWLSLAAAVHAPEARAVRIAGRPPSEAAVAAARTLYTGAAERVAREAKRAKRWDSVAKIRDEQSAVLYADAGSPVPPPDELVALYRDGRSAVLRSLAAVTSYAELVAAGCCRPCREDDGKAFRIATELREPRLPHAGCPRGLCGCDWWMTVGVEEPVRKRRAASARTAPRGHAADGEQTPEAGPPTPPSPPT